MQTIILYLCYIVLILLFSTAYNTSLIYCFVIWCLHTNKRRPCSSTLSGHPSSSFFKWGYPQSSSIYRWDFPNKNHLAIRESLIYGNPHIPIFTETPPSLPPNSPIFCWLNQPALPPIKRGKSTVNGGSKRESRYILVGGIPTPLKNMTSSVGMMTFPTEWKIIKIHCSKTPTTNH